METNVELQVVSATLDDTNMIKLQVLQIPIKIGDIVLIVNMKKYPDLNDTWGEIVGEMNDSGFYRVQLIDSSIMVDGNEKSIVWISAKKLSLQPPLGAGVGSDFQIIPKGKKIK